MMPQGAVESAGSAGPAAGARKTGSARALIESMRARQWLKNSVIFAALIFSQTLMEPDRLLRALAAFGLFCAFSSAVYILNDILDLERDRLHPSKRLRPIAAGALPVPAAAAAAAALVAVALPLAWLIGPAFAVSGAIYLMMNVAYSLWLKTVVILDVMVLASGYVIRAVAGGLAIDVAISAWLILCTILLSLFLGFTKRRQELAQLESLAVSTRAALRDYSVAFLDQMISIVTSATVVAYALYTLAPETRAKLGTPYLPLTIPFVLYGIFRYLYLVHRRDLGESPTGAFYADPPLYVNVVLWAIASVVILYFS